MPATAEDLQRYDAATAHLEPPFADRRPGRAARQRGGHDPARRGQADPAGQQVGALPRS